MIAGYERFGGSSNRNNSEVMSRIKTSRGVYNLLRQGVKPSAMIDILNDQQDSYMADNINNSENYLSDISDNYQL